MTGILLLSRSRHERRLRMRVDPVERRLAKVEKLAEEIQEQAALLRSELGKAMPAQEMWGRMMFQLLEAVNLAGGEMPRDQMLEVARGLGYDARGVAGFYQKAFKLQGDVTVLTPDGKNRLEKLRLDYGN
jgi:hypothetical protein